MTGTLRKAAGVAAIAALAITGSASAAFGAAGGNGNGHGGGNGNANGPTCSEVRALSKATGMKVSELPEYAVSVGVISEPTLEALNAQFCPA